VTSKEHQAIAIVKRLREHGFEAYLAGGCVRDKLLGVEPKDFDVATSARAEQVQVLFPHTVPVGVQFGVVLVLLQDTPGSTRLTTGVEVATFRTDGIYLDGRHPTSVHFSNAREDARRRDFTINGMFYDPLNGQVLDYVGGQQDLKDGIIRAIGNPRQRFAEDRLRMIRTVRLAARLGFAIHPDTFAAIRQAAATITAMAWERIGDEVVKILTEGGAKTAFTLLCESGLLRAILPEVEALKGVEQSPDYHPEGDVFTHTLLLLEKLDQPTETLALGALLHDIAKPPCQGHSDRRITFYGHCEKGAEMAVAICQRLKRSRATWERVAYLVKNHLKPLNAPHMRVSTLKRFLREDGIEELLELVRMDALSSSGNLQPYEFCWRKLEEFAREGIKPPRLLSGRDLIKLGLTPGPRFREILTALEEAQLEGQLSSREEALAWAKEHFLLQDTRPARCS
jgi:poly(A) polymerase